MARVVEDFEFDREEPRRGGRRLIRARVPVEPGKSAAGDLNADAVAGREAMSHWPQLHVYLTSPVIARRVRFRC